MREKSGIGEHRRRAKRIAERQPARPFEHWIGKDQHAPAKAHPLIEDDEILRRLSPRLSHQQQPPLGELGAVGDADRNHAIAGLSASSAGEPPS